MVFSTKTTNRALFIGCVSFLLALEGMVITSAQDDDCFESIHGINDEMERIVGEIESGVAVAQSVYVFELCKNTLLYATMEPLVPIVNSVFMCGPDGTSTNNCTIFSGANQVEIQYNDNVTIPGVDFGTVDFVGVTFQDFHDTSITAYGSSRDEDHVEVTFTDCIWKNFSSDWGIDMYEMDVSITDSVVMDGDSDMFVWNHGGLFEFSRSLIENLWMDNFVLTTSGGETTMDDFTVVDTTMNSVTYTNNASTTTTNVEVLNNTNNNVFYDDVYYTGTDATTILDFIPSPTDVPVVTSVDQTTPSPSTVVVPTMAISTTPPILLPVASPTTDQPSSLPTPPLETPVPTLSPTTQPPTTQLPTTQLPTTVPQEESNCIGDFQLCSDHSGCCSGFCDIQMFANFRPQVCKPKPNVEYRSKRICSGRGGARSAC